MELIALSLVFLKIGAVTFGGGLAMLPILEAELCKKRSWLESQELLDYFAIGQITPGIIAVNVATFVGYKKKGLLGSIVATLSIVTPSIIVITIIALFISNFSSILWVKKAILGINIAVAALLTYSIFSFAKKSIHSFLGVLLCVASFVLIFFFKVSSVWVILASGVLGFVLSLLGIKKASIKTTITKGSKKDKGAK